MTGTAVSVYSITRVLLYIGNLGTNPEFSVPELRKSRIKLEWQAVVSSSSRCTTAH